MLQDLTARAQAALDAGAESFDVTPDELELLRREADPAQFHEGGGAATLLGMTLEVREVSGAAGATNPAAAGA